MSFLLFISRPVRLTFACFQGGKTLINSIVTSVLQRKISIKNT